MKTSAFALLLTPMMALASGSVARAEPPSDAALAVDTKAGPSIVFIALDSDGNRHEKVRVTMDKAAFAPSLDGTAIPLPAGTHAFTFETEGLPVLRMTLSIREGEAERQERVVFSPAHVQPTEGEDPAPTSPETSSGTLAPRKIAGIAVAGLGVAGLGVAAGFGIETLSKYSAARAVCESSSPTCPTEAGVTKWNSAISTGNIATYTLIAGAALVAVGAWVWFSPSTPTAGRPSTAVGVGPGSIELKGTF